MPRRDRHGIRCARGAASPRMSRCTSGTVANFAKDRNKTFNNTCISNLYYNFALEFVYIFEYDLDIRCALRNLYMKPELRRFTNHFRPNHPRRGDSFGFFENLANETFM